MPDPPSTTTAADAKHKVYKFLPLSLLDSLSLSLSSTHHLSELNLSLSTRRSAARTKLYLSHSLILISGTNALSLSPELCSTDISI